MRLPEFIEQLKRKDERTGLLPVKEQYQKDVFVEDIQITNPYDNKLFGDLCLLAEGGWLNFQVDIDRDGRVISLSAITKSTPSKQYKLFTVGASQSLFWVTPGAPFLIPEENERVNKVVEKVLRVYGLIKKGEYPFRF